MQFAKIMVLGALVSFCLPITSAHALPSKVKALHAGLNQCEKTAKNYSSLGYTDKAMKQLLQCKKIKGQLAKIKAEQAKVNRTIASLDEQPQPQIKKSKVK